jgi:hypothetical protein
VFVVAHRTIGLRLAGFLLAVAAVALLTPTARAGCGDYVHIANAAPQTSPESQAPPVHPGPCQGPNCSRRPEPTPLPPAAPAPVPVEQAACVLSTPVVPVAAPGLPFTDPMSFAPFGHPFRLERPPRS